MTDLILATGLYKIVVYIDSGLVFEYEVGTPYQAERHVDRIMKVGYRRNNGTDEFVAYPVHRIVRVEVVGGPIKTDHPDRVRGS